MLKWFYLCSIYKNIWLYIYMISHRSMWIHAVWIVWDCITVNWLMIINGITWCSIIMTFTISQARIVTWLHDQMPKLPGADAWWFINYVISWGSYTFNNHKQKHQLLEQTKLHGQLSISWSSRSWGTLNYVPQIASDRLGHIFANQMNHWWRND